MLPFALLLLACDAPPAPEAAASAERTAAGALSGGVWSARADGLEVRLDRAARLSGADVVLQGRASRDLDGVYSWVPDDLFGTATLRGPTRFEARLNTSYELGSILSGLPLMVAMHTRAGRVRDYNAWVGLTPELRVTGAPAGVTLEPLARPVFRRDADTLRYRAILTAPGAAIVTAAGAEARALGGGRWAIDWTRQGVTGAAAVSVDGATLTAAPRPVVTSFGLTTDDPYNLGSTACEPGVLACVTATRGDDLSACGTWREVSRCADPCARALALTSAPADELAAPAQAWNDAAAQGGQWGSVQAPTGWLAPGCASLDAVVGEALAADPAFAGYAPAWGDALDRDGLAGTPAFSPSYSAAAPDLLAAIEAYAGSDQVEAWYGQSERPCPNCHAWDDLYVLFYPDAGRVIVLSARHGWDS